MSNDDLFICIDHVGYAVHNLDDAIKFHTEVLGWRVLHRETNAEQGVEEAMIGTGDQLAENARCSCWHPEREQHDRQMDRAQRRQGRHPAGRLPSGRYRRHCAVLRERGVRLLYDEPKIGTGGSRINFAHPKDVGGILLEIVEPAAH